MPTHSSVNSLDPALLRQALVEAFKKLDPRRMIKNPVMFVVELGSCFTSLLFVHASWSGRGDAAPSFILAVSAWLWFTVLFSNFAESMAETRGRAQADALREARRDVMTRRAPSGFVLSASFLPNSEGEQFETTSSARLAPDDVVLVVAGDVIPSDGEVILGVASVDESAITGESAPVIRESGGDRSAVTGGTRVLSDFLVVRVTSAPGATFLDKMIAMVEGAERKKTPNEVALDILLAGLTLLFLFVSITLLPFSSYAVQSSAQGSRLPLTILVALLVCLSPTTIGGLLSAIGIAGMDRLVLKNVLATSGRAVEAAGDVDVLLLDKTGTITLGNRQASDFVPAPHVRKRELAEVALRASWVDETPEGRSIVALAEQRHDIQVGDTKLQQGCVVPFSAHTKMSGVDIDGAQIRKGAVDAIRAFIAEQGGTFPPELGAAVDQAARQGATPLLVAIDARVLGMVVLKDIVKAGIHERFSQLRAMGIKTVMITGDNPLTAAAIAADAGVDDFLAEATPRAKLEMIRKYQSDGHVVAMTGDGTNDAPALAQADVAVAMNTGTQAAKEAGNMVDLDSNPTKLLDIVHVGKQMLMTRGALTTFSIANDLAKYFAIIPAAFLGTYPALGALNVMALHSPQSAILSAVVFNALIIVALIPLALRGVVYRPAPAAVLLRRNLLVYGLGGVALPFGCIKCIDLAVAALSGG